MSTTQIPAVGFLRLTQIIGSKKKQHTTIIPREPKHLVSWRKIWPLSSGHKIRYAKRRLARRRRFSLNRKPPNILGGSHGNRKIVQRFWPLPYQRTRRKKAKKAPNPLLSRCLGRYYPHAKRPAHGR